MDRLLRALSDPRLRRAAARWWPLAAGLLVALLSWKLEFRSPEPYVDPSARAGLALAAEHQLQFGSDIVFSYGPLGFLRDTRVWFADLAVAAFLYSALVHILLSCGVVAALARVLSPLAASAAALIVLTVPGRIDEPLALGALACLALARVQNRRALDAGIAGLAVFAAVETLAKISVGPGIFVAGLIALASRGAGGQRLGAFAGIYAAAVLALWLALGQSLSGIGDFIGHSAEIVSGYSAEVALIGSPRWQEAAAALGLVALVAAAGLTAEGDRRARWGSVAIVAFLGFGLFKEGVVRLDAPHLELFFSTAAILWIGLRWGRRHVAPALAGAAALVVLAIAVAPSRDESRLNVFANLKRAGVQTRNLFSPSRLEEISDDARAEMAASYEMDPRILEALGGRTVAVEPWEVGAAWAYRLDWEPLPVFQTYAAYTAGLDGLNGAAVAGSDGPDAILRQNTELLDPQFPSGAIDGRYRGWESPLAMRMALCYFRPLITTAAWQLLMRTPDRCGEARPIGTVEAGYGEAVDIPAAGPRELVYAEIDGAAPSGFERLQTLLLRGDIQHAVLDGGSAYRIVRGTAENGLLLRGPAELGRGPYAVVPQAETIELEGDSGPLRFDFYAMALRPAGAALRPATPRAAPRP